MAFQESYPMAYTSTRQGKSYFGALRPSQKTKKSNPSWGIGFGGKWSRYHVFFLFFLFFGGMYRKHVQNKELLYFWVFAWGKMKWIIKLNEGRQWKTNLYIIIFNYQEMLHLHSSLDRVVLRWDGQSGWDPSQTNGIKRPRTHKTYWSCQVLVGASVKGLFLNVYPCHISIFHLFFLASCRTKMAATFPVLAYSALRCLPQLGAMRRYARYIQIRH